MHVETDSGYAAQQWKFDSTITAVFDDMLARSIPQYEAMRSMTTGIAAHYAQKDTAIVDLGCSRGGAIEPLTKRFAGQFIGIEVSPPMFEAALDRFKSVDHVEIRNEDLRSYYPPERASVALAILTLQFTPIEYRQQIVRKVYKHLVPGGAFIFVEKLLGESADLDKLFVEIYYDLKRAHGYDEDQIERKRLSLEGVLVPVTAKWNTDLLQQAGFSQVDCFWRWMNFAGFIGIK